MAAVLGLPSPRAAKEFIATHGIPHIRLGKRVFVLAETLVAFLRDREKRRLTKEEARKKATETVRQIAPTARARNRGRKPPRVDRGST
jgi:hypothetical protein